MLWLLILAITSSASAVPADICDQTFEVLAGQTRTINYLFEEGTYPGNSDCVFHLQGAGAEGLMISFTEFDIERHATCNFDYLQIFDGPSVKSPSVAKLCGSSPPSPVEVQSNTATLKFASDRTVHKRGFILQFSTRSSESYVGLCHPAFTQPSGTITSPLYPSNYPNRVNCTYEITPSIGNQILIQFPTFQLERSSYCVMDYVTISTRNEQIGGKLCGDLAGNSYLVPGSHAIINFVSDRSSTRKGFQISYKIVGTCKELENVCSGGCMVSDDGLMECTCDTGYQSRRGEAQCYDVDECAMSNGGCEDRCSNTQGSFQCSCTKEGFFLAPDGFNCTDRSCAVENAGCEHNCHLSGDGGYFCTCNKGYLVASNGHNCTDIDECTSTKYKHSCEQTCNNEPGSYYCDCTPGYILSHNQRTCNDINECLTQGLLCDQDCHNYPGGWTCTCYPGYEVNPSDPNGCVDIDECSADLIPDNCDECINYEGGFSCTACSDGYIPNSNETVCLDINECSENNGGCQQDCINIPGSFQCSCYKGQELIEGTTTCRDINECAPNNGRGPCDHYCENSVGSFQCHCLEGYLLQAGSGITCQDIDECLLENGGCTQQCNNSQGSYQCSCFSGYWMTDGDCQDVDECVEDKPCDKELGAECINNEGSFECVCPSGYTTANTTLCLDIDECDDGTTLGLTSHGCSQKCVNTPGSFHCTCHDGFVDVGNNSCVDLNECSQSICQHPDLCENTIGGFICNCPPGFFLLGDGKKCSDIDECAGDLVNCDHICLNEIGTYKCACRDGYELNSDNYTCSDINECQRNISGCSDGCINTNGGFYCFCNQGREFAPNTNLTCQDTDECATNNGGCHHVCTNTPGSFTCGCRDGYSATDNMCHDINECDTNNGGCDQDCVNLNGTYVCQCSPDFKLKPDNHTCGHCPTCDMFEQVVQDVKSMKPHQAMIEQLRQANMQLSATVALLRSELDAVKRRVP